MNWDYDSIKDVIQSVGVIFTIGLSIYAIVRSSKISQNANWDKRHDQSEDSIKTIKKELSDHILQDSVDITTLQTEVRNLKEVVDNKLEKILEKLDEQ